jgi:hypothetical protein
MPTEGSVIPRQRTDIDKGPWSRPPLGNGLEAVKKLGGNIYTITSLRRVCCLLQESHDVFLIVRCLSWKWMGLGHLVSSSS